MVSVYPNTFNSMLTIRYQSVQSVQSVVNLAIYDISGREVADLLGSTAVTGGHFSHPAAEGGATNRQIVWNASSSPAGVYFVRLQAGEDTSIRKVVLVR
jgi:hypothetical protein